LSLPYSAIDSFEGHSGERTCRIELGQIDAQDFLPHAENEPFDRAEHVVLVDEGHLDVDLRELRLTIDTKGLVAKALDDLKVLVEPGHHVELLEELRALGQRVEFAGVHARRNEKVARAAGGVLDHDGRLELEKPALVEVATGHLVDPVAHAERFLHRRSPQVQVPVLKTRLLAGIDRVEQLEWRRLALVEDGELDDVNFDLAGPIFGFLFIPRPWTMPRTPITHSLRSACAAECAAAGPRRARIDRGRTRAA
jgi:hypothetical protein